MPRPYHVYDIVDSCRSFETEGESSDRYDAWQTSALSGLSNMAKNQAGQRCDSRDDKYSAA